MWKDRTPALALGLQSLWSNRELDENVFTPSAALGEFQPDLAFPRIGAIDEFEIDDIVWRMHDAIINGPQEQSREE